MLDQITAFLKTVDDCVWNIPLIVLILGVGLFLSVRLKGLQIVRLPRALKYIVKSDKSGGDGEVSSFGALCTALSATIGTGNIVGVATAIVAGGPGALFWMWLAAILGMATKYAECLLAVKYRKVESDGHIVGGPFYYIENGLGKKWKWLAAIFAIFGICVGLFGIGTFTQVNSISDSVQNFFDPDKAAAITLFGRDYSLSTVIAGLIVTLLAALVIIGGIKRISKVAEIVVPFMAGTYVLAALIILFCNFDKIPAAIGQIFAGAFGLRAAAAKTGEPVRQGLVSMTGTFIDTIIICTMTGLSIVITGAWDLGLEGVAVTTEAFRRGLPFSNGNISAFILMLCLVFFAFTTILGWNYYSERCVEYLTGGSRRAVMIFKWIYIAAVFIGPYMTIEAVWTIADICNGLMAIPNLFALTALSGVVVKETRSYFDRQKQLKITADKHTK